MLYTLSLIFNWCSFLNKKTLNAFFNISRLFEKNKLTSNLIFAVFRVRNVEKYPPGDRLKPKSACMNRKERVIMFFAESFFKSHF